MKDEDTQELKLNQEKGRKRKIKKVVNVDAEVQNIMIAEEDTRS